MLGCREERRVPSAGGLIQLRAGASLIDIVDATEERRGINVDHFCLRIEPTDMRDLAERLASEGIEARFAPRVYGADGFGEAVYLVDPEGNTVELKGPPE